LGEAVEVVEPVALREMVAGFQNCRIVVLPRREGLGVFGGAATRAVEVGGVQTFMEHTSFVMATAKPTSGVGCHGHHD
jgi:hypothetical protein